MSWQDWENAVTTGHVKYLYKFDFYTTVDIATSVGFCTGREEVEFNDLTYYPRPVAHDSIKFTYGDISTTLHLPASQYWIEIFIKTEFLKCDLTIYRYKEELQDGIVLFRGKFLKASLNNTTLDVDFGFGLNSNTSEVLTYWVQRYCNHIIYDKYCGLNSESYKAFYDVGTFTVTNPNTLVLQSSPYYLGSSFNDFWRNGLVILMGYIEIPDIVSFEIPVPNLVASVASPTTFILKWNIPDYVTNYDGKKLTLLPNCMGDLKRCREIFGNEPRSCGWPDMPSDLLISDTLKDAEERNRGNIGHACT